MGMADLSDCNTPVGTVKVPVYITIGAEEHGIRRVVMSREPAYRKGHKWTYFWRTAPMGDKVNYYVGVNCELSEEEARAFVRRRRRTANLLLEQDLEDGRKKLGDASWPPVVGTN